MPPAHRYEIGVARSDYQRAKDLLGFDGEFGDTTYNQEEDDATDAPFDVRSFVAEHLPHDPEIRKHSYLDPWYPEDAIVEVWSQDGDDISAAIAMALKENLIHFRIDLQDGVRKVFVLSEDESRARQIVREIVEGI